MMEENLFYQAVQLAREGRKIEARGLIQRVLSANPFYEMAWLWYADCAVNDDERIHDLEAGLRINPNMPRVMAGLRALQRGKPTDLGRTQPVFIGKFNGSKSAPPFYGLDDNEPSVQDVTKTGGKPFVEPSADDLVFENVHEVGTWSAVFTVLPERISPEEFAEIERRTQELLASRPRPRYEDPWKHFRSLPEPNMQQAF